MSVVKGHLTESGRISLPAGMRRELGLPKGGPVIIRSEDGAIAIRSAANAAARAQEMYRRFLGDRPGTSVDEFLRWRQQDGRL